MKQEVILDPNLIDTIEALKEELERVKKSELRHRQFLQGLQMPIYTTDAQGFILSYNKAAAALWGREPEIGKDKWCGSYKIYNTDGLEVPLDKCPVAIAVKEARPVLPEEIILARQDGSKKNVTVHPQPIFCENGEVIGAVNMLLEATVLKTSEQALLGNQGQLRQLTSLLERQVEERTKDLLKKNEELTKSEERYHKMIEEVEDYAIVLLNRDGIIQNWNKGAEKIKGYKEEEIVGNSFKVFYPEEDRKRCLPDSLLDEARRNGKAIHEGWRVRKDGSKFWGSIVITALHDVENNVVGFSKVTRDLTERKKAEDKLIEYTNQLEFQNKELEQFAYAASHDMKEPLRKINFYNSYVVENAGSLLDDRSREYLNRSSRAAKRMSQLIEDILAYTKISSAAESFEETDLNEIVEEIAFLHRDVWEEKDVTIEVDRLPVMSVVPFQFKQLMDNLINNSIKYKHPDRKPVIKITSQLLDGSEVKIKEVDPRLKYNRISVSDNGLGFNQNYSEKIFEIFQRLDQQSTNKGSGIGLALCKRIVQNHHGFITASGKEREGARFDIYLPVFNS